MFKKLALASLVFMFLGLLLAIFQTKDMKQTIDPRAIVRLHDPKTGMFFCTGTIINNTQLLTAAHCVAQQVFFTLLVKKEIDVYVVGLPPKKIKVKLQSVDVSTDLAILEGNFKDLPKIKMEKNDRRLLEIWSSPKKQVIACGYPYGGGLICVPVTNRASYFFAWKATGFLYPGMSGGPVIDLETGKVIASNTGVLVGSIILAPVIGIEQILQIFIP